MLSLTLARSPNPVGQKVNTDRTAAGAAALSQEFGGHSLARTERIEALDGTPPKRFIITAFDSKEKAHGWFNSPAQKKVNEVRLKKKKSRAFIVEGL